MSMVVSCWNNGNYDSQGRRVEHFNNAMLEQENVFDDY